MRRVEIYVGGETQTVGFAVVALANLHGTAAYTAHAQVGLARDGRSGLGGNGAINSSETGLTREDERERREKIWEPTSCSE